MHKKIALIAGVRPEIIKESPLIREFEKRGADYFVIYTGQHYNYEMERIFFEQLNLPLPKYNLNIRSTAPFKQGEHTGRMLIEIENILLDEMPDLVLTLGDTNSTLAGALTARKLSTTEAFTNIRIMLGHIEAGLRSYDKTMPEEINRILADHLSDYLFAPTHRAAGNMIGEGIHHGKITVTGNTIVDALNDAAAAARENDILERLALNKGEYFLATFHRQENADVKEKFANVLEAFGRLYKEAGKQVLYPAHPRSRKLMERFNLRAPEGVRVIEPLGFMEFLQLEQNASLVLTDSGGVQEETCVLGVPCVTLRENTERPETIDVGSNTLAGTSPDRIIECVKVMTERRRNWENPFGDGNSARRIADLILK
ncbi:MAG: UDP-N-acetylglucosamine 2-epimerase (non-hydrolyzing) [Candidatus Aenigmarchaeota archaeon]|nr:UDP-N-acetylglucosamine 2-epimerase (non-hydrolyzing) [Candidatus Aenigmarchaeota archaeon]